MQHNTNNLPLCFHRDKSYYKVYPTDQFQNKEYNTILFKKALHLIDNKINIPLT